MEALNTRHAWRPVLRPVSGVVIAAQLLLAIQPLSALAQDGRANTSPAAQAQVQRLAQWQQRIEQGKIEQARAAQPAGAVASERTSRNLARVHDLLKGIKARTERPTAVRSTSRNGNSNGIANAFTPKATATDEQANQAAQEEISQLLAAIDADTDAVLADFAALRQQLQAQQVSPEILARHDQTQAELDKRANELRSLIRQWRQAPGAATLSALDTYFERYPAVRERPPLDPAKLPWSNPKPNLRPPAETKIAWFQKLNKNQQVKLAQVGGGLSGLQFSIPPEPGQAPAPADLAETEDVQLSAIVKAQAAQLNHNPVEIAAWVRNNINWLPTWGSVQGSELTLLNQSGNAIDIASLTVALLRASGIPARYVIGTVEVDAAQLQNWIGDASSPWVAIDLMQQGGIASRAVVSAGAVQKIRMEHAWVKAYVNWAPGRGARQGGAAVTPPVTFEGLPQHPHPNAGLNAWVDLDTSYKQYTFTKPLDIAAAVPLDTEALRHSVTAGVNTAQGYVEGFSESAAIGQLQNYQARVSAYLAGRPALTLGDLVKSREVISDTSTLLAGVPPFPALVAQQMTSLPASLRHSVVVGLYASAFDRSQDSPQMTWRVSLPALGARRLGVTYEPASASDAQMLADLKAQGATSFPAYLLNLRPTVRLDGTNAATAPVVRAGSAQAWSITFENPSGIDSGSVSFDNTAGDEIVFGVNGNGIGLNTVMYRVAQDSAQSAASNLEHAALLYWLEHDQFDQMIASRLRVLTTRQPSVMQMSAPLTVRYFYGIARSASYQSRVGDAKRVLTAAAAPDEGLRRQFMVHAGIQGSSIEGSVLDQLFNRPDETSVSTTQIMAIAAREGQRIYSITQENISSALPALAVDSAVKEDIENAVANGMVAFVPEREIAHKGYRGVGYILMDPDSGAAAYLIDGGRNGLSQPDCVAGVTPPEAEISVSTIMNWEALGPALVGFTAGGAAKEAERQAAKIASEAIARAAKTSAQRIAARTGPRVLTALAVPGANVVMGVALAAALTVEIYLLMIEIKLVMAELGIQQLTRTEEDTCECKKNSNDPKCACKKIPTPHKPALPPDMSTAYNRRVKFHHQCADSSGNSYPGNDVQIISKQGGAATVDLFNEGTQTACEVKTSFRDTPYEPWILDKWKSKVIGQINRQITIAQQCNWNHCIVVNKAWLKEELSSIGTTIYLRPSCAQPIENDPFERPIPGLD
ncbi:hypothetical protein GmRootA79_04020 [Acidovorax sp. A79]|uniref:transglutaminase-like domain-containing protein n=1 Tax=Acidovorax sp. A79 TaxID=3056107 RepID=UPI0034E8EB54